MAYGTLYMIPSPIGEGDPYDVLPERNRAVMASLDYFIAENLRTVRRFLSAAHIGRPISELQFAECSEHTPSSQVEKLIGPLIEGHDVGLVSEAGLPGVADPGAEVVALCHRRGIRVVPLVGPSSLMMALMASGQNGQSFAFNGYLPIKPAERAKAIRRLEQRARNEQQAQIFIEAPYRNAKLFDDLLACCSGGTVLTVASDITNEGEFIFSAAVGEWKSCPRPDINKRPAIFIIGC